MLMERDKPITRWPGDSALLDGTRPVRYVGPALALSALLFSITFVFVFVLLWRDLPGMPIPHEPQVKGNIWYHMGGMFSILVGYWIPSYQYPYWGYVASLKGIAETQSLIPIFLRWFITLALAIGAGIFGFKAGFRPIKSEKQVRGKVLMYGLEAYRDLFRNFFGLESSGLPLGRVEGFDPRDTVLYGPKRPKDLIELPEKFRRTHSIYVAGTGRGKTQTIYSQVIAPIYQHIRAGSMPYKLLVVDTPKSDYSKYFNAKDMVKITPVEKGGATWDIAKDITDALIAEKFWKGAIPSAKDDDIWTNAARLVATGMTRTLQILAPGAWNFGMLANFISMKPSEFAPILSKYYPESTQVVNSPEQTIMSVMFNIATYAPGYTELGRIFNGYDCKGPILQSTAAALKFPEYVSFVAKIQLERAANDNQDEDNRQKGILEAVKALMFKGTVLHLNKTIPEWKWIDFANYLKETKLDEQFKNAEKFLKPDEKNILNKEMADGWIVLASQIVGSNKLWDNFESLGKFSIKEWVLNENPEKKILVFKPSEAYETLTSSLIRGMLYFTNSVILGGELKDSKTRKFQILIDELQSNGNIEQFLGPALALYRSKGIGITLAFQDLSQLDKLYGEEFVQFLTGNVGNIFLLGVNQGTTAEKLSDMVGKMSFVKLHTSQSLGKDGGSSSLNYQEHDRNVISADEINTYLGANEKTGKINYLYLPAGLNPAYILSTRIINYKERHVPIPAKWIGNKPYSVKTEDVKKYWERLNSKTEEMKAIEQEERNDRKMNLPKEQQFNEFDENGDLDFSDVNIEKTEVIHMTQEEFDKEMEFEREVEGLQTAQMEWLEESTKTIAKSRLNIKVPTSEELVQTFTSKFDKK